MQPLTAQKLFERCANHNDRQDRLIKRSGPNKKRHNLEDIISLLMRKQYVLPVIFVAKDLGNLPAIGFDKIDVSMLLIKLQNNMTELDMLKETVATQSVVCTELQTTVTMQAGVCDRLNGAVSSLIAVAKPQDSKTPKLKPLKEDASSVRLVTTPVTSTSVNPDNVSESVSYAGVVATSANTPRPSVPTHSTGIGLEPQW